MNDNMKTPLLKQSYAILQMHVIVVSVRHVSSIFITQNYKWLSIHKLIATTLANATKKILILKQLVVVRPTVYLCSIETRSITLLMPESQLSIVFEQFWSVTGTRNTPVTHSTVTQRKLACWQLTLTLCDSGWQRGLSADKFTRLIYNQ